MYQNSDKYGLAACANIVGHFIERWPSTQLDHAQLSLERSTYRCCEPNRKSEVPVHVFKEPSGFCDANGDVEESQEEGNTSAWK